MVWRDGDRDWSVLIATGFMVLLFGLQGGTKVAGSQMQVNNFETWGYPLWFMYTIGVLELVGAIGLLFDRTAAVAASGLLIVMGGAFITHLLSGQYVMLLLPVLAGSLLAHIGWKNRPEWLAQPGPREGEAETL